jgi:DNA-binding NarL/FixJ family response regulator
VRPGELVDAIRVVASGNALLGPSAVERLLRRFSVPVDNRRIDSAAVGSLTDREAETLRLLANGLSNAEIAATLVVSETTVKTHVSNLLRKLGVRDRVQAVIAAYDAGVVQPKQP